MPDSIKDYIPRPVLNILMCLRYGLPKYKYCQYKRIRKIRKENHANVVFLISSLPMWRYQGIFDKLISDNRFDVSLVFCPFSSYCTDETEFFFSKVKEYFSNAGVTLYDASDNVNAKSIAERLNPDIIFYPQHYEVQFSNYWDIKNFKDRLVCYIPYGLYTLNVKWAYRSVFNTIGWRMYYASSIHKSNAARLSYEFGHNVRVVGEPHADEFRKTQLSFPWPDNGRKRIIYAPHFRIIGNDLLNRPSFLWTADIMLDIALNYRDQLQIAFKPHPRLFSELCKHPDWGEEKARNYYEQWKKMPNTQFENGDFIELFKSSDALIHDCGSFTAEYQYTKKPCMFLTKDEEDVRKTLCEFGNSCLDNHYIGSSREDIVWFIDNVILAGVDPKMQQRDMFYNEYLMPPVNRTTAENIYYDLVESLFK